jgi:hypothetical protein
MKYKVTSYEVTSKGTQVITFEPTNRLLKLIFGSKTVFREKYRTFFRDKDTGDFLSSREDAFIYVYLTFK